MYEEQTIIDAPIHGQIVEALEVSHHNTAIAQDVMPTDLAARIERQKENRAIMTKYVRDEMVDGHHFYRFKDSDPPALTQEGAYLICGLFNVILGPVKQTIVREDDGHFTVVSNAQVLNSNGICVATGDGSATTREKKHAGRWVKPDMVPIHLDKDKLKYRSGTNQGGGKWEQYLIPNEELGDLENTIIKMSAKRATVAAVKKLPLVSELFATDPRDLPGYKDDDSQPKRTQSRGSSAPASVRQSTARHQQSSTEATATGKAQVQVAVNLAAKLVEFGMEEESLAMMFLPEGVAKFDDLSEKAAIEVIPGMSELLNNKVKEAKEGKAAAA